MNLRRLLLMLVMLVSSISLLTLTTTEANGPAVPDQPNYTVEQRANGKIRVRVQGDLGDKSMRDLYAARQREEAAAIAHSESREVPLQITFVRPLSIDDVQSLAASTGLVIDLALFEARDANQKLYTVGVGVSEGRLQAVDISSIDADPTLHLVGITVVQGKLPSAALESVVNDERIYIPDVSAYRIATEVARSLNVAPSAVEVSVPTPHWYLTVERTSSSDASLQ